MIISLAYSKNNQSLIRIETLPLFLNLSIVIICALAIYMTFQSWDIDMTAWLASAGIVGIAIDFAAKDTLANLFSGVFIMVDAPYKIGDFIVLDSGERGEKTNTKSHTYNPKFFTYQYEQIKKIFPLNFTHT